jgi:hypothetical protein
MWQPRALPGLDGHCPEPRRIALQRLPELDHDLVVVELEHVDRHPRPQPEADTAGAARVGAQFVHQGTKLAAQRHGIERRAAVEDDVDLRAVPLDREADRAIEVEHDPGVALVAAGAHASAGAGLAEPPPPAARSSTTRSGSY